jgi:glycerol-3-phosphate dehydrogenase (NAD(P)+)
MAKITVVGAGMMGSALCVPLCDGGHRVRLVGTPFDADEIASLKKTRHHVKLGLELPAQLQPYRVDELEQAMDECEIVALGVNSAGIGWAADALRPYAARGLPLFGITKGLANTGEQLQILPDLFRARSGWQSEPMAIAGPCIAGELACRVQSCVLLTGRDRQLGEDLAPQIATDYYHVGFAPDAVGVEVCAALKNAYAMGVAFGAGIHERDGGKPGSVACHNIESAVFAQALLEMARVVEALGGRERSVLGLAGAGDLDVTNNGGRTGRFGRFLGRGLTLDEAIEAMQGATLECLQILAAMRSYLAGRPALRKRLPLLEHMAEVALDGRPVKLPFARFFAASESP